jgi:hypothetical protein
MVKQYITNKPATAGFNLEQCNRFVKLMDGFHEQADRFNQSFIEIRSLLNTKTGRRAAPGGTDRR